MLKVRGSFPQSDNQTPNKCHHQNTSSSNSTLWESTISPHDKNQVVAEVKMTNPNGQPRKCQYHLNKNVNSRAIKELLLTRRPPQFGD